MSLYVGTLMQNDRELGRNFRFPFDHLWLPVFMLTSRYWSGLSVAAGGGWSVSAGTHPPETAVLVLVHRVQQVRWVVDGPRRFCLARSHAARERSRVAPGFVIVNHTQVTIANLCGPSLLPRFVVPRLCRECEGRE